MSMNQLLDRFLGAAGEPTRDGGSQWQAATQRLGDMAGSIPGGLAGGAAAGGIVALLVGNKSARKIAGKAATYGGAALLGGLAYRAYSNWKQQTPSGRANNVSAATTPESEQAFHQQALNANRSATPVELSLIRAMIAAARADGHIDADEQGRIFAAVDRMALSSEHKAILFDSLQQDVSVHELAAGAHSIEHKSEIYLASCLVIDPDHPAELAHLESLATALELPAELCRQLEMQARQAYAEAA